LESCDRAPHQADSSSLPRRCRQAPHRRPGGVARAARRPRGERNVVASLCCQSGPCEFRRGVSPLRPNDVPPRARDDARSGVLRTSHRTGRQGRSLGGGAQHRLRGLEETRLLLRPLGCRARRCLSRRLRREVRNITARRLATCPRSRGGRTARRSSNCSRRTPIFRRTSTRCVVRRGRPTSSRVGTAATQGCDPSYCD